MEKQREKRVPRAADHRLDEPTGLSLGMGACPECPLPFRPIIGKPETIRFTGWPLRSSRGVLAATLVLLSGSFQLAVPFRVDLLLTPRQCVLRRDVADGTVQADVVVMLDTAEYPRFSAPCATS
jgi:hypothetical protein